MQRTFISFQLLSFGTFEEKISVMHLKINYKNQKNVFYVPAGHIGSSLFGIVVTRWKSSWQGLQKCVVPKQKNTATEQQYRHLYSRKSAPCFGHICALATSLQPPHTNSAGSNDSPPNCASQRASPP